MFGKRFTDGVKHLPVAKAPDSIWESIEAALDAAPQVKARRPPVALWWAAAAATVIVGVGLYWHAAAKPKPEWDVTRLEGAPSIGGTRIAAAGRIGVGQWLQTDAGSRAQISVGDIGTVQVEPNTRVRLVAARPQEHRLALARGEISAVVSAPPRLFFVDTASSTAVDLGCAYTMKVDDSGNGLLRVTLGRVSLEWDGRESLVPAGASCRMRPKLGPGTPYFEDSSDMLQQALASYDASAGASALDTVLAQARPRDTLTLWHLLSRTSPDSRARVLDRMIALARLPDGVSRDQVLRLDPEALNQWRDELTLVW